MPGPGSPQLPQRSTTDHTGRAARIVRRRNAVDEQPQMANIAGREFANNQNPQPIVAMGQAGSELRDISRPSEWPDFSDIPGLEEVREANLATHSNLHAPEE